MDIGEDGLRHSLDRLALEAGGIQNGPAAIANGSQRASQDAEEQEQDSEHLMTVLQDGTALPAESGAVTKKKKKKSKAKKAMQPSEAELEAGRIRISRNKHMRFISSYHVCLPMVCIKSRRSDTALALLGTMAAATA